MERALIVGVNISNSQSRNSNNRYESFNLAIREMISLAKACEMEVVGQVEQNMENANTATYIVGAELLKAGVEVGYSKEVKTGFKVGEKSGGYYISFTDESFDALLQEYLREKVANLLYK